MTGPLLSAKSKIIVPEPEFDIFVNRSARVIAGIHAIHTLDNWQTDYGYRFPEFGEHICGEVRVGHLKGEHRNKDGKLVKRGYIQINVYISRVNDVVMKFFHPVYNRNYESAYDKHKHLSYDRNGVVSEFAEYVWDYCNVDVHEL